MRLIESTLLLLLAMCEVLANPSTEAPFKQYMIVPTYLSAAPASALSVRYNNIKVNMGNEIVGFITHLPPFITYEANPSDLYTFVFVDLDAPSTLAPYQSPYLHFLVINIPGANITAGTPLTAYIPPTSDPGSGFHRYLFLVYKQNSSIECCLGSELINLRSDPTNFSLSEFSSRYNLGDPIAGNFFTNELSVCGPRRNDGSRKRCS